MKKWFPRSFCWTGNLLFAALALALSSVLLEFVTLTLFRLGRNSGRSSPRLVWFGCSGWSVLKYFSRETIVELLRLTRVIGPPQNLTLPGNGCPDFVEVGVVCKKETFPSHRGHRHCAHAPDLVLLFLVLLLVFFEFLGLLVEFALQVAHQLEVQSVFADVLQEVDFLVFLRQLQNKLPVISTFECRFSYFNCSFLIVFSLDFTMFFRLFSSSRAFLLSFLPNPAPIFLSQVSN